MTVDPCPEAGHQALVIGNASMKDRCAGWLRLVTKGHGPWAYQNRFRFRNHISTLPQPNFGDSATENIYASATKKAASATKKRRFRNQKKPIPKPKNPIPQPKKDDSATTIHAIQKPKSASHLRPHSTWHRLQMRGGVGWGGVGWGWDNNVLAAAFPRRHTCCHTQHGIVSR